jgi:hypothetical protein
MKRSSGSIVTWSWAARDSTASICDPIVPALAW